ncbi:fungal-specific transcription factor domain-containing protein [Aspergillus unguis]
MQHSDPDASSEPFRRMQANQLDSYDDEPSGNGPDFRYLRRKPVACEACYKRKTKCEFRASSETCTQCMRRNVKCKVPVDRGKPDNPRKRARYIRTLEDRLRKTEALLRTAGILVEPANAHDETTILEDEADDAAMEEGYDSSSSHEDAGAEAYSPKSFPKSSSASEIHESRRLITPKSGPPVYKAEKGNSLYYGRSTPLSILTREGVEWIKNKSGEANSLNTLLSNSKFDSPWAHWRPDVFYDVFSSQVFKPLPPRAEVFSLLEDYFKTVNFLFPLYHEKTFMQLVEWQYTQQTCDDAARWASINIILALAYEYRVSNSQKSEKEREKAWLYYKNALSVFPELALRRADLLSVQALLGMAMFLRGNSGSQSTVPIITAAIRTSHRMGLHREVPRPHISQVEQQQRRNVFWIAYVLDQSISIRLGSAPTQHFDDFDVKIPSDKTVEGMIMTDNKAFFPQVCRIAVIRSRIYRHFYSAKALEGKSTADICETIHKLHADLQDWERSSRFHALFKAKGTNEDFLAGFASAGLFLMYYNSLIMVHRPSLMLNYMYHLRAESIPEFDLRLILNQSSSSAAVCVQAARDTLKLVNNLPWGDLAWIWSLLYYIFLAVMTIFTNILRNSQQPNAKDDLQSLTMAATFFGTLIPADGPYNYARFMTRVCTAFERTARAVFERDQKTVNVVGPKTKLAKTRSAGHSRQSSSAQQSRSRSQPQLQSYPSASIPNIPNLEGLPPINSSGYVVRESPTASPGPHPSTYNTRSPLPTSFPATQQHHHQTAYLGFNQPQPHFQVPQTAPTPVPQVTSFMPSSLNINEQLPFPIPSFEETSFGGFPGLDLWQFPLAADWELGSGTQFYNNPFGPPDNGTNTVSHGQSEYLFQNGGAGSNIGQEATFTGSTPATVPISAPVSSVPTPTMNGPGQVGYDMAYGSVNGNGNVHGNGDTSTDPYAQPQPSMWVASLGGFGNPF